MDADKMRFGEKIMSRRCQQLKLLMLSLSAFFVISANAAEIDFSSDRDFAEINLNIRDQGQNDTEFVALSVKLTPAALHRLQDVTRDALNEDLTISLNGNVVSTVKLMAPLKTPHLKLFLTRQMAHDVFPSLLATPVSSVSLSGFSMPQWAKGTWTESLSADVPNVNYATDETLSVSNKILNAPNCKRANHTIVATNDSVVELRIDRRNKCVVDDVPVSKVILTRTTEPARIVISLYAIGSDFNGPPTKESTYRR
ncbi:hypothetical protein RGU75_11495 [Glaciimonas sp. CA11.2]|uniref:hypothetical protein n=2 Tax=Glaciimonas sp. CA11.2 TaxID=3048601 RepID=UPI002AB52B10|nr:hypothetical protein [Glaciimonas sp. CA11.2]MDY7546852.1 hypothetical protein [Glaciimonas sp. CA11.2]